MSLPSAVGELVPVLGSVDVALGSGCPEYGSNIFYLPFGMGTYCPGKRPSAKKKTLKFWTILNHNARQSKSRGLFHKAG